MNESHGSLKEIKTCDGVIHVWFAEFMHVWINSQVHLQELLKLVTKRRNSWMPFQMTLFSLTEGEAHAQESLTTTMMAILTRIKDPCRNPGIPLLLKFGPLTFEIHESNL